MSTADRDPSSLPMPLYWIPCLCIAGLSVICGIITCICLDRHMKKKLMAYLNEHQELQSVASEEEIEAVSKTKRKNESENQVTITVSSVNGKNNDNKSLGKNVNKSLVKKTTTAQGPEEDTYAKEKVPVASVKPITNAKLTSKVAAVESTSEESSVRYVTGAETVVSVKAVPSEKLTPKVTAVEPTSEAVLSEASDTVPIANYFESDKNVEAESVADSEESSPPVEFEPSSPPVRLEPSKRRHQAPPLNAPVKSLKKRSAGMNSSNPSPMMVAAIAATAAAVFTVKPKDGSEEPAVMTSFSKIDDNENDLHDDSDVVTNRGEDVV